MERSSKRYLSPSRRCSRNFRLIQPRDTCPQGRRRSWIFCFVARQEVLARFLFFQPHLFISCSHYSRLLLDCWFETRFQFIAVVPWRRSCISSLSGFVPLVWQTHSLAKARYAQWSKWSDHLDKNIVASLLEIVSWLLFGSRSFQVSLCAWGV